MSQAFVGDARFESGLTYGEYLQVLGRAAQQETRPEMTAVERNRLEYTRLNLQRTQRIAKTYRVSDPLRRALEAIDAPQRWLVISEPWCGDSAQCLPYIAAMAEAAPRVEMRILLRDQNLDVMDRYLTDGKRAIPLLVAADDQGRELFRWGPRPAPAAALFAEAQRAGTEKPEILEALHLWYGRDRGRTIDAELGALLGRTSS